MDICEDIQTRKSWLGSSISDICKGKGPWSFNVTHIAASKYHAVLYDLPALLSTPPKPHRNFQPQHWDENHVRMPFSDKNLFPDVQDGKDVIKSRWSLIKDSLSKPIKNSRELEAAILSYNSSLPRFLALHYFFEEVLNEEESDFFFRNLLPKIITLALDLPDIVPGSFPLLKKNHNRSVSISQLQISSLLANAFLCTFPWKKDSAALYPGVNFVRLFAAHARPKRQSCVSEKIKCIVNYFRRVLDKSPVGVLTFERKFIPQSLIPRWDAQENNLGNTKIHIDSEGTIEENGLGFLQVDFANKNVGGGVLGYGCVQEEIRFVICPELIISRLFVEQLGDHEAVIVSGSEQYSKYSGYGDTFKWEGNNYDTTPHDEYGRRKTTICIIDATRFNKPSDQFYASAILREINKAYVGFSSRDKDNLAPVATGNWGCGAFRGSCELKSLIQLVACSVANRDLVYYSFGNENLRDELYNMHTFLANNRVTVAQLWRFLCGFSTLGLPQEKLYSYIQQALFDSKKQPTIKKFFGVNPGSNKTDGNSSTTNENKKTSISTKVTEIKSKQNCKSDNIEDLDLYLPFYPQTSTSSEASEKKQKHRLSAENISPKVTTTDITEIIDIIDGNTNRPKKQNVEVSMSAELDRFKKKDQRQEVCEKSPQKENEKLEIEACTYSVPILTSPTQDKRITKHKITDYFQLKATRSS